MFSYLGIVIKNMIDECMEVHVSEYLEMFFELYAKQRNLKKGRGETPACLTLFSIDEYSDILSKGYSKFFHSMVKKAMYMRQRLRIGVLLVVLFLCT